jgi:rare lipoprotein A
MTSGVRRVVKNPLKACGHGAIGLTQPATSGGSRAQNRAAFGSFTSKLVACSALCGIGLLVAGCASQDRVAQGAPSVDRFNARYGVSSSPRVVEDGQPIPRGGGVYRVGRPYMVGGRRYTPYEKREGHQEVGIASWYGRQFHGRLTANGEVYDMNTLSAAHRTMPMPSYARVTNLRNGHSLIVRVNDRGPFHGNRVIDLSNRASHLLDFRGHGLARVRVEYVGRAPLEGSDERSLMATLRTDGSAAPRPGQSPAASTMIASAAPQTVPQQPAPQQPVLAAVSSSPAPAPTSTLPALTQMAPQPAEAAPVQATQQAAPQTAITVASAPLPLERPAAIGGGASTTVVARTSQPTASSVTVVATPAPQAAPQPVVQAAAPVPQVRPAEPALASSSSRPVSLPTTSAFAAPAAPAPAIAAMPGGPARASLGFGALY